MMNETSFSRFDAEGLRLARTAAAEGMVLLRNEQQVLPLDPSKTVALFGRAQIEPFLWGGGAACMWHIPGVSFAEGISEVGSVYEPLLQVYRAYAAANFDPARNVSTSRFGSYLPSLAEVPLTEQEIELAAQEADTAIFFLGRFAGETVDLSDEPGEYRVTSLEASLMRNVCSHFSRRVLILNLAGLCDLSFLRDCHFDAIIYAGLPGMEGGHALADLLYGFVTPSGRLPDSWAETLNCYPVSEGFGSKRIVYTEGIYMGYRYFDTFDRPVLFPFGFGLSYTSFSTETVDTSLSGTPEKEPFLNIMVRVTNVGNFPGREVIQCYISFADGDLEQPAHILAGFDKTPLLAPGASTILTIRVNLFDLASYREIDACTILEAGDHVISVGRHSRDTVPISVLRIEKTVIVRRGKNRLTPRESIDGLRKIRRSSFETVGLPVLKLDASAFASDAIEASDATTSMEAVSAPAREKRIYSFSDVISGRCTPEELAECLSDEELSLMLTGDGNSKRKAAQLEDHELVRGEGSHSHPVPALGIPATVMQDGPNGLRLAPICDPIPPFSDVPGTDCVCYPCSTLVAASWDRLLARQIASAIGRDMARYGVEGWCAPAINLHRDPRCGRNFEYFSEDPILTAEMAIAEIAGMQEDDERRPTGRYAILKHFACNESESKRRYSDSILSERAARELYLRPFEVAIRHCPPRSIMTSYNLINGVYASANIELLEGICRSEWGYDGWIMTDWDVIPDASECIRNGIDIEMPGRLISPDNWEALGLTREIVRLRVARLIRLLAWIKGGVSFI